MLTDAVLEALPERDPVVDLEGDPLPVGRGGVSVEDREGEGDRVEHTEKQDDMEGEGVGVPEPEAHLLAEGERVGVSVAVELGKVDWDLDWVRDTVEVRLTFPEALQFREVVKDADKV